MDVIVTLKGSYMPKLTLHNIRMIIVLYNSSSFRPSSLLVLYPQNNPLKIKSHKLNCFYLLFFHFQTLLIQRLECKDRKLVKALVSKDFFHHVIACQYHAYHIRYTPIQQQRLIWIYRVRMRAKVVVN